MLVIRVLILLLTGGLLGNSAAQAQQKPPPQPPTAVRPQKVLTVHVTLPSLVARLGEVAGLLVSRDQNKKDRAATDNPVLVLTVPLPRFVGPDAKDSRKEVRK